METLKVSDNVCYEFDREATWEKDGKTYEFISLKKITNYKENKKYQNLTIKPEHWAEFSEWFKGIIDGIEGKEPGDDSTPF